METSNHEAGGGYHVLQQNRREKLRNQRSNITQSQQHYGPNFDLPQLPDWQYTNIPSDSSSVLSSEMLNFAPNSHPPFFHPHKHIEDDPVAIQESTSNSPRFDKQKIGSVWIDSSNLAPMFGYQELGQYHQNTLQEVVTSAANPTQPWLAANDHFVVNNTQALSLSLSSVSPPKTAYLGHNIGERPGNLTFSHRDLVPLGPFTGYATILKSSRFLKPAQQLLDEFCNFPGHKALSIISEASGDNMLDDDEAPNSTFYTSSERSSNESSSHQPEYLQNKVKLLYMQDEVCRRYRQYHQQMQMVVSSFESVAGLSAATPYISLALKAVLCQFRCFKNAISDQLAHIRKELGEATPSPCIKRDNTGGRPSTLQNQNPGGQRLHYLEPQPHVWRPQRGLPERAVAVLRAWLFDHFLHPYPTDTDKHMLAAQTGLTRNQVSNWFINARVRVWKPMVEEIHVLETKTMGEKGSKTGTQNGSQPSEQGQHLNVPEEECPPVNTWNQEKRLRIDCGLPAVSMGNDNDTRQLVAAGGFMPYHQRNSLEMGSGLGAVSLTLGLRQSVVDGGQQHQHDQSQFIRQRFGGQIIHDLAG